jgi:hypothetical protein
MCPNSAFGEFEVTHDCSDITCASFLNKVGKRTPLLIRLSTVGGEAGSAGTSRDVHGWAMKMYTDEGNLDWVFNNTVSVTMCCQLLGRSFSHFEAGLLYPRSHQVPFPESIA